MNVAAALLLFLMLAILFGSAAWVSSGFLRDIDHDLSEWRKEREKGRQRNG